MIAPMTLPEGARAEAGAGLEGKKWVVSKLRKS
jgi:hypothetical protein